jgi:ribosome-binding factor A
MREFGREERVGTELHRELALLLRDEVRDPRLNQVTIQEVRVVRDLSHARVFFTLMDRDQAKNVEKALNKAASFLRRRLGELVKLRTIPQLHFEYDHSLEHGLRLSSLIDKAVASEGPAPSDDDKQES